MISYDEACKLTPDKLIKNIFRIYQHLLTERDFWIIIVSREGEGKSTLGQLIGALWVGVTKNPALFSVENNVYGIKQLKKLMHTRPKYSCIESDEGSGMYMRADAMTKEGKDRKKLAWTIRSMCHLHIIALTETGFAQVDPMLLKDRVKAVIRIPKRGRLFWYSKNKLAKIEVDRDNQCVKRWGKPNWKASFRALPKKEYEEYNTHKRKMLGTDGGQQSEKYYSVTEVAKKWMMSHEGVQKWVREKKIKAVKNPAGAYRIPEMEVNKYMPQPVQ